MKKGKKKIKNNQVHRFSMDIYPLQLDVVINPTKDFIESNYEYYDQKENVKFPEMPWVAYAYRAANLKTKDYTMLVMFNPDYKITPETMAHEASHVADYTWSHICENSIGKEAHAYLVEWVVKCMCQAIKTK